MGINKYKKLVAFLNNSFEGDFLQNEPISLHTWYQIGGAADFFVYPRNIESLTELIQQCNRLDINTFIIGEGANILASDTGFRGVMINLARYINNLTFDNEIAYVSAGVLLQDIVLKCEQNSLGGLEYMSGIPGTVGGALIMNAGTHLGEIGDRVAEVFFLDNQLKTCTLTKDKINFNFRDVPELEGKTVLGCKLLLYHEDESILKEKRLLQLEKRAAKQPLEYPSCGSVFKRPPNHYVGKMVEELGLKGFRYGNAMISEKHGGFIVNLGNAKASDIIYLINKVQDEVYNSYSVSLEREVKYIGF